MISAQEAKKITESRLKANARRHRIKAEQEQIAKNKRQSEVVAEALKILNETAASIISKAASEGENSVKIQPMENWKLSGYLNDGAFIPFTNKLKAAGYKVKIVDTKSICRSGSACFDGMELYSTYFEVSW
jgi:hypothetical protein